jgi:hypothetical protein
MRNINDNYIDTFKLERDARKLRADWFSSLFGRRKH